MVNESDREFFKESINIVKAVSKLLNVQVFDVKDYQKKENSICDSTKLKCSMYLVINDNEILQQAKERIEKKRAKAEKKLKDLMKQVSSKKYSLEKSEIEKQKDQEKVCMKIILYNFATFMFL